jgi:ATP-binding cassette subfamily C (CFTR/MRP) protein 1
MEREDTTRTDLGDNPGPNFQCIGTQTDAILPDSGPDSVWSRTLADSSTGSHTRSSSESTIYTKRPISEPFSPPTHGTTPLKDDQHAREQSAEVDANTISRLVFEWVSGLLWVRILPLAILDSVTDNLQRGYQKPLELHELPLVHPERRAKRLVDLVQRSFDQNIQAGYKHALFWALYEAFKREFWIGGICRGIADILLVITPYTLRYLIQFSMDAYVAHLSNEPGPPLWHGIAYLCGILAMLVIQSLTHNHYMYLLGVIGGQSRAIMTSAIFNKSVRVLDKGKPLDQDTTYGKDSKRSQEPEHENYTTSLLAGFLSSDCARIAQTASALHILWTAPLSLATALSLCKLWIASCSCE